MGALEIGKLDKFQILGGGAAIRTVGARLQHGAIIRKGVLSKSNHLVVGDDVLSVRERKEANCPGFCLPLLSPTTTTTLLIPSTGVLRMACTCQMRFSS